MRMEAYGNNTEFQVLGKFHAFLRWKGHVYRQLFYTTNANASPNLLSKAVATHWECLSLAILWKQQKIPVDSKEIPK